MKTIIIKIDPSNVSQNEQSLKFGHAITLVSQVFQMTTEVKKISSQIHFTVNNNLYSH